MARVCPGHASRAKDSKGGKSAQVRRQLIVLGMHRSGTSAITRALAALGAHVGTAEELTSPNAENPHGFFERRDARQICNELLRRSGSDWWKVSYFDADIAASSSMQGQRAQISDLITEMDKHGTWAIKEPRLCFLLPIFRQFLRDPAIVLIVRNPLEVARSLRRRHGFSTQVGLALWEAYNIAALKNSVRFPRVVIVYHELVSNPTGTIRRLCKELLALGVEGLHAGGAEEAVDATLYRERTGDAELLDFTTEAQKKLWAALANGGLESPPTKLSPSALLALREFEADETARQAAELEKGQAFAEKLAARDAASKGLSARVAKQLSEAAAASAKFATRDVEAKELAAKLERQQTESAEVTATAAARLAEIGLLTDQLKHHKAEAEYLTAKLQSLEREIARLTNSASWRITAPIRSIASSYVRLLTSSRLLRGSEQKRDAAHSGGNVPIGEDRTIVLKSGLFDEDWYLAQYAVAEESESDPVLHYLNAGAGQGYDPHPLFNTDWYLERNPDVRAAGINPLVHYLRFGANEGCDPHPLFDSGWYLSRYPDVAQTGMNPLVHYVRHGGSEGRDPNPVFDSDWYLAQNGHVAKAGINPLVHYFRFGAGEGRNPSPAFDGKCYLEQNPDVARCGMNPLAHYLCYGLSEGRKPHPAPVADIPASASKDSNLTTSAAPAARIPARRASVAVVGWDLGHNAAGRAYVLADLARCHFDAEMLGPCFPAYGDGPWPPLRKVDLPIRHFVAGSFEAFIRGALDAVEVKGYDAVYVSKPRFPSLFIGLLYKLRWGSKVIVDIDDHELSFFNNVGPLALEEFLTSVKEEDWANPYGERWTRLGETMLDIADSITVSNPTLQHKFGGAIVRHARDERVFDPALYDRRNVREEFGLSEDDKVVLFVGTPRPHKGIFKIAEALDRLGDPKAVLCLIGTIRYKRVRRGFESYPNARIVFHDDQPFERLPELTAMADVICILQDPAASTAQHQLPAKLTDALALKIPVLATLVPPLEDVARANAILIVDDSSLLEKLKAALANVEILREQAQRGREYYLSEFSYAANVPRLRQAVEEAMSKESPIPPRYAALVDLLRCRMPAAFESAAADKVLEVLSNMI